ncbi:cyclic peptide export ABC transporter [Ekhidna sp.]|uniref:cyclic peptide export ABC transporter n=1 Tax=Ekhidna sp. TaxID=2608089 RepID=UPI0032EF0B5B
MQVIRLLLGSSKKLFLIAAFTSVLTGLFSTMVIKTIHESIQGEEFQLNLFIQKFAFFWIMYGTLSVISSYAVSKLTQKIIHQLRIKLSNSFLKATFETMEHNQKKMLPILTEDIKTIAYSIDRLPNVTTGLASIIGILAYMVWYSPLLSGATVLIFVMVFLFTKVLLPYIRKYEGQSRTHLNDIFDYFHGLVFGIKELVLNKESQKRFLKDFIIPSSHKQNQAYLKESVAAAIMNRATDMILLLGIAGLIIAVFKLQFVTLEFFGHYLTLVLFTLAPLSTAAGFFSGLKRLDVALEQITKVGLELKPDSEFNEGMQPLDEPENNKQVIKLEQMKHSYYHTDIDQHFAMGPIDLSINKGEMLFIVGGNGSGKTTLAKLLLGLYSPLSGKVYYRGQEITEDNLSTYRSKFSAVFVDSYLFEDFLNVDKEYLAEHGENLIKMFNLENKVKIKNHKFTTKNLSEGQKKRLALIISILENKDIYLFDEWAANQDPLFKDIFYTQILPFIQKMGKTQIVITHDDRYFDLADRVIKLRDGKISDYRAQ